MKTFEIYELNTKTKDYNFCGNIEAKSKVEALKIFAKNIGINSFFTSAKVYWKGNNPFLIRSGLVYNQHQFFAELK